VRTPSGWVATGKGSHQAFPIPVGVDTVLVLRLAAFTNEWRTVASTSNPARSASPADRASRRPYEVEFGRRPAGVTALTRRVRDLIAPRRVRPILIPQWRVDDLVVADFTTVALLHLDRLARSSQLEWLWVL